MNIASMNELEHDADLDAALAVMVGLGDALTELKRASAERVRHCREQLIALKLDPDEVLAAIEAETNWPQAEAEVTDSTGTTEALDTAERTVPRRKRFGRMV